MRVSKRTIKVLIVIVVIVVAAYVISWISAVRRTSKHLADLASQEPDKVMEALAALRERGGAVGPQLAQMVRLGQGEAAARAAWLLGMTGNTKYAADLIAALQSPDPVLRIAAMQALGQLRYKEAVPPIAAILGKKDEKNEIRVAAAYALGAIGDPGGASALINALAERPAPAPAAPATGNEAPGTTAAAPAPPPDTTIPVRIAAARALGHLGDKAGIDALVTALGEAEPDAEVRVAAAYALGDAASAPNIDESAMSKAINGLLEGLQDKVGDVRIACIYALGKTRPSADLLPRVTEAIQKAKMDEHFWARAAAAEAVRLLRLPD